MTKKTDSTKKTPQAKPQAAVQTPAPPAALDAFDLAVGFVLKERIEGGYVNDPRDPGGETNFGISKRAYPKVNIRALTRDEAVAIYRRDYWDGADCDKLPAKIGIALFDGAVNQGVGTSKKLLQSAAGVTADGDIGPKTLAAVHGADVEDLLTQFLSHRMRRYAFTANAATYMRGWSNRILYLMAFLIRLEDA